MGRTQKESLKTMKRLGWMMAWVLCMAAAACASKNDDADPVAGGSDEIEPYQPKGNGQAVSEGEACERIIGALDAHALELGCAITHPLCPQYLRQSTGGACYDYDEGTIDSCVDFIGKYQSCEDFRRRPCIVTYLDDSTCETPEGGEPSEEGDAGDGAEEGDDGG